MRLLPALLLPVVAGCVVTETRTIVVAVPKATKTIEVYAVFEGVGVRAADNLYSDADQLALGSAKEHVTHLAWEHPLFLFGDLFPPRATLASIVGDWSAKDAVGPTKYGKLRYYLDPARERPLCADRRMTFTDRAATEAKLNAALSDGLAALTRDPARLRADLNDFERILGDPAQKKQLDALGWGPFLEPLGGLIRIAGQFDDDGVKQIHAAASRKGEPFRWLRFEPDGIRFVLPVPADAARRIAATDDTRRTLVELRRFLHPVAVEATGDGLALTLGTKDEPVRFAYTNPTPTRPRMDKELIAAVGNPTPRLVEGRPSTAADLVRRFIADPARPIE